MTSSSSSSFFTAADEITIRTLSQATESLQLKSTVQSVLNDIITDIETTNNLEEKLNHDYEVQTLRQRCENAERALEEYKLMEKEKQENAKLLVMDLVEDLGGLTGMLRELKNMEQKQQQKAVIKQDEWGPPKLYQHHDKTNNIIPIEEQKTEETVMNIDDGQDLNHTSSAVASQQKNQSQNGPENEMIHLKAAESSENKVTKTGKNGRENNIVHSLPQTKQNDDDYSPKENSQTSTDKQLQSIYEQVNPVKDDTTPASHKMATIVPIPPTPSTKQKRKILLKQRKKIKRPLPPTLQSLNSSILMKIFEFMDAMDIVNMAQTNVRMYSKVDSIFGLGGAGLETDGRDEDDADFEEVWIEIEEEVDDDNNNNNNDNDDGGATNTDEGTKRPESNLVNQNTTSPSSATIVSIPSATKGTKLKKGATPSKTMNSTQQYSTMTTKSELTDDEQNATATSITSSNSKPLSSARTTSKSAVSTSISNTTGGFQISSAVAAALADKLSAMELSAIITMRDQLRLKEQETILMKKELDTLNATLDGTLSVKEALTVKVKEQQLALDQNKELAAKMNRQTSSDQEVIAFLDERVQELEHQVGNFDKERSKVQEEIDSVKKASDKRLSVLGDMLTFEREQMADHEKEWKSTKKVLVKEVKHLRAQILALEAERDGYYEENLKLKEALLSVGSSSKASKPFEQYSS